MQRSDNVIWRHKVTHTFLWLDAHDYEENERWMGDSAWKKLRSGDRWRAEFDLYVGFMMRISDLEKIRSSINWRYYHQLYENRLVGQLILRPQHGWDWARAYRSRPLNIPLPIPLSVLVIYNDITNGSTWMVQKCGKRFVMRVKWLRQTASMCVREKKKVKPRFHKDGRRTFLSWSNCCWFDTEIRPRRSCVWQYTFSILLTIC